MKQYSIIHLARVTMKDFKGNIEAYIVVNKT